jgi:poly-beta-hydroxyalkanoate depolymerase
VPFFAVEGAVDDIAGIGQRGGKLPIEIRIVLNDKKAQ